MRRTSGRAAARGAGAATRNTDGGLTGSAGPLTGAAACVGPLTGAAACVGLLTGLAAFGLSGCGAASVATELGRAEIRVIVTTTPSGATVRALSRDTPFRYDPTLAFERGEAVTVWILGYELTALGERYPSLAGLPEAEVAAALAPSLKGADEDAPAANHVEVTTLRDGEAGRAYEPRRWSDWQTHAEQRGLTLRFAPRPADGPCARLPPVTYSHQSIGSGGDARFAVALEDGSVLVGQNAQRVTRIRPDRTHAQVILPAVVPSHAAATADGRVVWFGNVNLVRATLDVAAPELFAEWTDLGPPPVGDVIFRMSAAGDAVYTISGNGAFERYSDADGWTLIHQFPLSNTYSAVHVLGLDRVVAVSGSSTETVHYDAGAVRVRTVPGVASGISAIGWADGLGLLTSPSTERTLFVFDDGWRPLPNSFTDVLACAIYPLPGGAFVIGQLGNVATFATGEGVCERSDPLLNTAHFIAPIEGGFVVVGDVGQGVVSVTFVDY